LQKSSKWTKKEKNEIYTEDKIMLFKDVLEMWLAEKERYVKVSTFAYYNFEVNNYIIPLLGEYDVTQMTEEVIQEAVLTWQLKGMENGRVLCKSTVQNLVMLIKQVLRFASRKDLMTDRIVEIQYKPQYQPKHEKVFSTEEQKKLIQLALEEHSYKSFGILLCLNSGLRIGEICALKWGDIDIKNQVLSVTKTLQRIYQKDIAPKTRIIIDAPKTYSSIRNIPLSDKVCKLMYTFPERKKDYYILTNTEHYLEPRTLRKYYAAFLKRADVREINFHCLRHTFATQCIKNGADYKTVSEILGHNTINTTLNMYVHPQMEEKRKCVDLIEW